MASPQNSISFDTPQFFDRILAEVTTIAEQLHRLAGQDPEAPLSTVQPILQSDAARLLQIVQQLSSTVEEKCLPALPDVNSAQVVIQQLNQELGQRIQQKTQKLVQELEESQAILRQREGDLRKSQQQLADILDNSPMPILLVDQQNRYLVVNQKYEEFASRPRSEIIGRTIDQVWEPELAQGFIAIIQKVRDEGRLLEFEETVQHKDGWYTYLSNVFPLYDTNGEMYAVCSVCTDITRSKQAEADLQRAIEELERLNRLKDDFLSTVSHELRTPVANMKMSIRMLELAFAQGFNGDSSRKTAQYLQILNSQCDREISLINDLLDLQRLESGEHAVVLETIEVQSWLRRVVDPFYERAQARDQTIEIDLPSSNIPPFTCNSPYIERILAELLNNACKYTPPGEKIVVGAKARHNGIQLTVTNYGAHIPASELPRIFDKFYRVASTDPWKQGGTGLGLALVQKLIEHLGGSIEVVSNTSHTLFRVKLPVATARSSRSSS